MLERFSRVDQMLTVPHRAGTSDTLSADTLSADTFDAQNQETVEAKPSLGRRSPKIKCDSGDKHYPRPRSQPSYYHLCI